VWNNSDKTCPSAALFITNPTWPDSGSNPGRRGAKLATNRLSSYFFVSLGGTNVNKDGCLVRNCAEYPLNDNDMKLNFTVIISHSSQYDVSYIASP
jgi:hypothetical protein